MYTRQVLAQPLQYTVQAGDTLWDICEKVYGDSELWPKLWEMNPFITNPHLLKPGDVITLLENVPVLKTAPVKAQMAAPKIPISTAVQPKGYDLSGLANVEGVGYLSTSEVIPLGMIVSGDGKQMMFGKGDVVYTEMNSPTPLEMGRQFSVSRISPMLKDPLTGEDMGYRASVLGRVRIVQHVREGLYKGEIVKAFKTIRKGDSLLAYRPVSPCIEFAESREALETHISAIDEHKVMIGQYSIVYFLRGSMQGVRQGQVFEILRKRAVDVSEEQSRSRETVVLPDYVLGYCMVLDTTADTATGIVLNAKEAISNGAPMKSWAGSRPPRALLFLPPCRTE
ncbi:MAG: LysM domain-containing protein [Desulfatiglandaceae bacterium]